MKNESNPAPPQLGNETPPDTVKLRQGFFRAVCTNRYLIAYAYGVFLQIFDHLHSLSSQYFVNWFCGLLGGAVCPYAVAAVLLLVFKGRPGLVLALIAETVIFGLQLLGGHIGHP